MTDTHTLLDCLIDDAKRRDRAPDVTTARVGRHSG